MKYARTEKSCVTAFQSYDSILNRGLTGLTDVQYKYSIRVIAYLLRSWYDVLYTRNNN